MRRRALTEAMVREAVGNEGLVYRRVVHAGGRSGYTTRPGVQSSGSGVPIADQLALVDGSESLALLVPAATGAGWFRDYCVPWEVRFLKGRVRFDGEKSGAPFPSAVIVTGSTAERGAVKWWDIRAGELT